MLRIPGVIVAVAWLLSLTGSAPFSAAVQQSRPAVLDLLDRYAKHDFEAPVALAPATPDEAERFADELELHGEGWTSSRGANDTPGRRLIAATFVLDVVRVWSTRPVDAGQRWQAGRRLMAWGCRQLRQNAAPLEGERWWHLAAIGLFEHRQDLTSLIGDEIPGRASIRLPSVEGARGHLPHALTRFPNEPRLKLAQVVSKEIATWNVGWTTRGARVMLSKPSASTSRPGEEARPRIGALPPEITDEYLAALTEAARPWQGPRDGRAVLDRLEINRAAEEIARIELLRASLREFEALFGIEAVAAEAHLRHGYSSLRLGNRVGGLAQLVRAETLANDPTLLYLIRVYLGSAHEAVGQSAEAMAAYRRALDGMPSARTASLALASALMRDSHVADAYDVSAQLLSHPEAIDPISRYRTADYRFVMDNLERLKRVLP